MKFVLLLLVPALLFAEAGYATIFGNVRGVVHDPQHRPVANAQVTIRAQGSGWSRGMRSNAEGEFEFNAVPAGDYAVTVPMTCVAVSGRRC